MNLDVIITISISIIILIFIVLGMNYISKQEIKFYEKAQEIETRIKEDEDMTYDEVIILFNILSKLIHSRSERHRFIQILKMIEVRYHIEISNENN